MRFLESLVMCFGLAVFSLVLIASVAATFATVGDDGAGTGVGMLAGGCMIALAIILHGAMTRRPPQE
ncbi:MAG: hypothetical protein ACYS8X_06245 [Planctomycetota bacterium]|jgi:hypothetical protein